VLEATLIIGGAYLVGSIPSAFLLVRSMKGIDIRSYGSGNAGATNVMVHAGWWTGVSLGTFDSLVKGTLPVVVARLFDQSLGVQAAAGLVAVVGHNWSPFLRFTGGRGVATALGVVLGFPLWWEYLILTVVIGLIGRLLYKDTGFWTLVALVALPVSTGDGNLSNTSPRPSSAVSQRTRNGPGFQVSPLRHSRASADGSLAGASVSRASKVLLPRGPRNSRYDLSER